MKKFTNLEDELLKENLEVTEKYNNYTLAINAKMEAIKNELATWKNEKLHWGHVGSLSYIDKELDNIIEHLGLQEEAIKKYNL